MMALCFIVKKRLCITKTRAVDNERETHDAAFVRHGRQGADPTKTCATQKGGGGVTAREVVQRNKQAVAAGCLDVLPQ